MAEPTDLAGALLHLRAVVAACRFDLPVDGSAAATADRDALVRQADDHLVPRLRSLDAPLLAVVGGSTGAGKSTLVNGVVGEDVTVAGVLRPTTRSPVLVCHPDDRRWFEDDRVLPGLARTTGASAGGHGSLHLVTSTGVGPGLALLDAPDVDSVVDENRALAAQLLSAADLWIFVTTAARYADAVPWGLLSAAADRSAAVAVVLDRTPPEAVDEVAADLRRLLAEHALEGALLHTVEERALVGGRLPDDQVAPLRAWLVGLAGDADERARLARKTLDGALTDVERRVAGLVAAAEVAGRVADDLVGEVGLAYGRAGDEVADALADGALLRGEVLDRWQELVGTGELLRSVQAGVSRLRDRVRASITGRPTATAGVQDAVESALEAVVRAAAGRAAARTVAGWRATPAGRALVAGDERALGAASPAVLGALPGLVRAWQGSVLELVREEGAGRRTSARIASFTLNGAGLAVMLAVFAHTGGLTGAEVAVAGGTSAASQKLLEAVFGDQAVRTLARRARADLLDRVAALLADDAGRFTARVERAVDRGAAGRLREALGTWRAARRDAR